MENYFGKNGFIWFVGVVEDRMDPEKLGRVKVSVYDCHDKIEEKDLPWSQVVMPGNTPAKGGIGSSVNLLVGTLVCGVFKDPEQQEFMVIGTLPTKTDSVEDNNVRVRAEADPNAAEPTAGISNPRQASLFPWSSTLFASANSSEISFCSCVGIVGYWSHDYLKMAISTLS
jgi:hypothetical protein